MRLKWNQFGSAVVEVKNAGAFFMFYVTNRTREIASGSERAENKVQVSASREIKQ